MTYYVSWDPTEKKFVVSEYGNYMDDRFGNMIADSDWSFIHNCVYIRNEDLSRVTDPVKKCPDCLMFFWLGDSGAKWYTDRGLKVPKRCPRCRLKRRTQMLLKQEALK